MSQDVTSARDQWLNQAKRLVKALVRRNGLFIDLCPARYEIEPDEKEQVLAKLSEVNKEIEGVCNRLAQIEAERPVGAMALIGDAEIPDSIRMVVAILALNRLSGPAESDFRKVSDLQDFCGGRCPKTALAIRDAFTLTGQLRPYVHLGPASVIDEAMVVMKETAFAEVLGRTPSDEALILDQGGGFPGRRLR